MPPIEKMDGLQALNSNPLISAALNLIPISQADLMVGSFLFPNLEIPVSNVRFRTYDLGQASALVLDTLRALDAKAKEIRTTTSLDEVTVDEFMLKTLVDELKIREAATLGIDYTAEQISVIRELMVLAKEYRLASIAISAANYGVNNKSAATFDFAAAGIYDAFMEAHNVIAGAVGRPANGILFGRAAWRKVKKNTELIAAYTSPAGGRPRVTPELVADYLEVPQVAVGLGGYRTEDKVFHPFWDDVAVMTYSERDAPMLNNMSFGYNVMMTYNGIPFDVRMSDPQGVERLIEAGCAERYRPVQLQQDAGFLFQSANNLGL